MQLKQPVLKDVVLIGAGHAHVAVLRMFGMAPLPGARFTLITREVHSPYSGMLPGLIAGHYRFDDAHIDTAPLARFAGARLYQDEAIGLDLANRRVICRNRPPVPYDLLSIDIGSTPNTAQISGAVEHAIPVKPIDGFLARFMAMKERVLARKGSTRIAVIGGGAGGVELPRQGSTQRICASYSLPPGRRSCRDFRRRSVPLFARSSTRGTSPSSRVRR